MAAKGGERTFACCLARKHVFSISFFHLIIFCWNFGIRQCGSSSAFGQKQGQRQKFLPSRRDHWLKRRFEEESPYFSMGFSKKSQIWASKRSIFCQKHWKHVPNIDSDLFQFEFPEKTRIFFEWQQNKGGNSLIKFAQLELQRKFKILTFEGDWKKLTCLNRNFFHCPFQKRSPPDQVTMRACNCCQIIRPDRQKLTSSRKLHCYSLVHKEFQLELNLWVLWPLNLLENDIFGSNFELRDAMVHVRTLWKFRKIDGVRRKMLKNCHFLPQVRKSSFTPLCCHFWTHFAKTLRMRLKFSLNLAEIMADVQWKFGQKNFKWWSSGGQTLFFQGGWTNFCVPL